MFTGSYPPGRRDFASCSPCARWGRESPRRNAIARGAGGPAGKGAVSIQAGSPCTTGRRSRGRVRRRCRASVHVVATGPAASHRIPVTLRHAPPRGPDARAGGRARPAWTVPAEPASTRERCRIRRRDRAGPAPSRPSGSDVKTGLDEVDEHLVASEWLPPVGEVAISDRFVADVARRTGRGREAAGRESTAWLRVAASGATCVISLFSHAS
jgi:hypothetical protein